MTSNTPGRYGDHDAVDPYEMPEIDMDSIDALDDDLHESGPHYDSRVVVKADAKNRSLRTLFQGAIATVVVAVIISVTEFIRMAALGPENVFMTETWVGLGSAAGVAALTALTGYVQRRVEGT